MKVEVSQSCLTLCNSMDCFPGQNTGVGSLSPLQGIFPTQGSNPGLLHCRQILSHQGSLTLLMEIGKVKQTEHKANRMMKIIKIETEAKKKYIYVYVYVCVYIYIGKYINKNTNLILWKTLTKLITLARLWIKEKRLKTLKQQSEWKLGYYYWFYTKRNIITLWITEHQ